MDSLQRAYRYCEWITRRHYENFPVASWLLPAELRPHVSAVYAFARPADDFADESRYHGRSLDLLQRWRSALWAATGAASGVPAGLGQSSTPPETKPGGWVCGISRGGEPPSAALETVTHPIFLALADTVRRYDLPVQLLDDLLAAFTMDVTKRRYADWEELMAYCRCSANPVGRLVLLLFGIRDEELHKRSDDICTALQMTNHWQDLRTDLARDILYIPQTLMDRHGVTETDLRNLAVRAELVEARTVSSFDKLRMTGEVSEQFRLLMKELVDRARVLFDNGEPLVRYLKGGLQLEIKLTLLGGRTILDRIESARYDVFHQRPVLSSADKLCLLTRAVFK